MYQEAVKHLALTLWSKQKTFLDSNQLLATDYALVEGTTDWKLLPELYQIILPRPKMLMEQSLVLQKMM